jgi:hypothetical protein
VSHLTGTIEEASRACVFQRNTNRVNNGHGGRRYQCRAGCGNPKGKAKMQTSTIHKHHFSDAYLELCYRRRHHFRRRVPIVGDYFLDSTEQKLLLVTSDTQIRDLESDNLAFVPDLDDLFEVIDEQLKSHGPDTTANDLRIARKEGKWTVELDLPEVTIYIAPKESLHSALLATLLQFSGTITFSRTRGGTKEQRA